MADTDSERGRPRASRLLLEGFVIVASILLAFAIDAAWDERQERAQERRLLEALEGEFAAHPPVLEESYAVMEEAYIGYEEARKRMTSLAASRGFYPVVALAPEGLGAPAATGARRRS